MALDATKIAQRYQVLKDVPLHQLAPYFLQLRDQIAVFKQQAADQIEAAEVDFEAVEQAIHNHLLQNPGQKSAAFEGIGTFTLSNTSYYSIAAPDVFGQWLAQNIGFNTVDLVQTKLKKSAVDTWVERWAELPSGVKKTEEVKLRFTAAKSR